MGHSLVHFPSPCPLLLSINTRVNRPLCLLRTPHCHSLNPSLVFCSSNLQAAWFPPPHNDDCGGWAIVESHVLEPEKKKNDLLVVVGGRASFAILIAAIAYISFTTKTKGFKFPLHLLRTSSNTAHTIQPSNASHLNANYGATPHHISNKTSDTNVSASSAKRDGVIIPIIADSTQQEAMHLLKKLKIFEDDVKADDLCTRRQYARWLVKLNSLLERNTNHRLVPSLLVSGSVTQAFDDTSVRDPDFWSIQVLAESGIVLSRLFHKSSSLSDHGGEKDRRMVDFLPESLITRLDLVNWKAQLEYSFMPEIEEKMLKKAVGFMDLMVSLDTSSGLFMDMLAGDKSILRKAFGKSKRFQPQKPATNAQAAVALTAGRMSESIHTELSRLEAEYAAGKEEVEDIRSELLLRGDIRRVWEDKLNEVKCYGLEAVRHFNKALHDLDKEKNDRDKNLIEKLKEKAALDCQRQLLLSLKGEIDEMFDRLTCGKADFAAEQQISEEMSIALRVKQEAFSEAKSILEAEKEALRILRSWIEDEAKRSQARALVLMEVGRRWKWSAEA